MSALNPPLATALESDAPFVLIRGRRDDRDLRIQKGRHAALTEGALACLVANAPGRLDRAWDLPVAICAWDGNDDDDDSKDGSIGDVNGDTSTAMNEIAALIHVAALQRWFTSATRSRRVTALRRRGVASGGDVRASDRAKGRRRAARARAGEAVAARAAGFAERRRPPPVHFATAHDGCVPVVRTHAVFSLGERKIVVRSTDMEVEAGDGSARSSRRWRRSFGARLSSPRTPTR